MIQLRDYQIEAIERAHIDLNKKNYGGTIIHFATGLGKTKTAAGYIDRYYDLNKHRVLFVVHTQDLILQTYYSFINQFQQWEKRQYTPFSRPGIGIVMGNYANQVDARIIIGTPQTLSGVDTASDRLEEVLKYGEIDLIIFDECHYAASQSYINLAKRVRDTNPSSKRLGLTATPMRTDGLALKQPLDLDRREFGFMFDSICISRNIRWGIQNKYLCPIRPPLLIQTNIEVPTFNDIEEVAAKTIDVKNWAELIVDSYEQHGENRLACYFYPSVAHAEQGCLEFNSRGIPAAHIDGTKVIFPDGTEVRGKPSFDARREIYKMANDGKIKILNNYNVLTHGFDLPKISLIGLARPTDSPVLVSQIIGRGTRLHPEKQDLLVLDYALKDVPLILSGSVLGYTWNEKKEEMEEDKEAEVEELSDGLNLADLKKDDELVDGNGIIIRVGNLFRKQAEAWYNGGDSMSLSLSESHALYVTYPNYTLAGSIQMGIHNGQQFLMENPQHKDAEQFFKDLLAAHELVSKYCLWHLQKDVVTGNWLVEFVNSAESAELVFDYALPLIERFDDARISKKQKSWRRLPPSDAQKAKLIEFKYDLRNVTDRGSASKIISHLIAKHYMLPVYNRILRKAGKYGQM